MEIPIVTRKETLEGIPEDPAVVDAILREAATRARQRSYCLSLISSNTDPELFHNYQG